MVSSQFSNHYGRRKTMMFGDLLGILFGLLTCIPNTISFGISRFVSGIALGILSSVSPIYMSEVSPPSISGKMGSLTETHLSMGLLSAYLFSLMLPTVNLDSDSDNYL